ncbi:MAG: HEPN domain-containing protein [Opitutales bacterium]|nr:HEPN domain-containing protein [Opitutales bacterium]
MSANRSRDWLAQAKNDLAWGEATTAAGFHAQACFIAQQVAEKSLKAIAYFRGAALVKGHSVLSVARELAVNGELKSAARRLDQYYIPTRYPDAQPDGAPFEFFSREQAEEALKLAALFLRSAENETGEAET